MDLARPARPRLGAAPRARPHARLPCDGRPRLGIPWPRFEDNPIDAMPAGHPDTLAAEILTYRCPGSAEASPVFVGVPAWAGRSRQVRAITRRRPGNASWLQRRTHRGLHKP